MTDRHAFSRRTAVMAICVMCAAPAAFADPVVPGFVVDQYASVPTPGGLAFDPGGVLYVGNLDPGTVSIHRVAVGGFPVEEYGPAVFDPDAVAFDANGSVSGMPGAVLVGGGTGTGAPPPSGYVLEIAPNQSASYLFGSPTILFRNHYVITCRRKC